MARMPKKPVPSTDELARMLWQLEAKAGDVLMQQMLDRLGQQTFVGGKRVAIQNLPRLAKQAASTVHRVKVSLHGSRPPVWRRLEIPSAMRLDLVHEVMQVAFGWHGYHLHAFETVCGEFGAPDDDVDWSDRKDGATAALAQVAAGEKAKVVYAYDFGDDWRHDIVVERSRRPSRGLPTRAVSAGGGRHRRRTATGSGPSTSTRPRWMTRSTPVR
jgi:hypothetical protein